MNNKQFQMVRWILLILVLVIFYIGSKGGDPHGNLSNIVGLMVLIFAFLNWRRSKK